MIKSVDYMEKVRSPKPTFQSKATFEHLKKMVEDMPKVTVIMAKAPHPEAHREDKWFKFCENLTEKELQKIKELADHLLTNGYKSVKISVLE